MIYPPDSVRIGIIPGIDGATTLLRPLAKELLPYHTVLLDYQEHGHSVEEVSSLILERIGGERISVLLGQSFGGPVAISLASRIPTLRAIILVSSFTTPPLQFLSAVTQNNLLGELASAFFCSPTGSWLVARLLLGNRSDLFDKFGEQIITQIAQLSPELIKNRVKAVHSLDISSWLDTLPPMLSVEARGDPLRLGSSVSFPKAGGMSVPIEGVHLLAETQPRTIAQLAIEFLEKLTW